VGEDDQIIKVFLPEAEEGIEGNTEIKILQKLGIIDTPAGIKSFEHDGINIFMFKTSQYYNSGNLYNLINTYNKTESSGCFAGLSKLFSSKLSKLSKLFSSNTHIMTSDLTKEDADDLLNDSITVYKLILSLVKSLQHCHANSIVHFDLKPENIMLKNNGEYTLHLVDFGAAKDLSETDRWIGPIGGSYTYIPPRQKAVEYFMEYDIFENKEIVNNSKMCDIYSLGCIIFNILTANTVIPWFNPDEYFDWTPPTELGHSRSYGSFFKNDTQHGGNFLATVEEKITPFKTRLVSEYNQHIRERRTQISLNDSIINYVRNEMLLTFGDINISPTHNAEDILQGLVVVLTDLIDMSTREHGSTVVPTTAAGTGERSTAWAETEATELSGLKRMSL
jgi:serine/threonine protein kinase